MSAALEPMVGCPDCGKRDLIEVGWIEDALLRAGGYGASRLHRQLVCTHCPWEMEAEVSEIRPLRRRTLVGQR